MLLLRVLLALILLLVTSCAGAPPSSSGDLDDVTVCVSVTANRTMSGSKVTMDVLATGCPDAAAAPDRVALAVWRSLRLPVDEIRVRLPQGHDDRASGMAVYSRGELENRYGRGPSGAVVPTAEQDGGRIWVLLPVAWIIAALGVGVLVRRVARGRGVVVFIR